MKILNYVLIAALAIMGVLFFQQCSSKDKQIEEIRAELQEMTEESYDLFKENNALKYRLDSCINTPPKEIIMTKYVTKWDTVVLEQWKEFEEPKEYNRPKSYIETVVNYYTDSTYRVTAGIHYKGELVGFNQMHEVLKNPIRTPIIPIDYTPVLKLDNNKKIKQPLLYLSAGTSFNPDPDFTVGLGYVDRGLRLYQVSKSINCKECFSINFNYPIIKRKIK